MNWICFYFSSMWHIWKWRFQFFLFRNRMAMSSAKKRFVPVPRAIVTSCCNRTKAPPSVANSAKVQNHLTIYLTFFSLFKWFKNHFFQIK
jgi:hypothetical protein